MARISKILGPDAQPVLIDDLIEEKAGPTLIGVRSPISGHPADGLTPLRLAAIHRAAAQGDPLAYFELAEDIEERDLHYAAVMATRKRSISQLQVTVEAASDDPEHIKHADFIREWLKEGVLDAALFDLLDAIGKGFSVLETMWRSTPDRIVPCDFIYRPQRWFGLDDLDADTPMLLEGVSKLPLAPHKYLIHKHPAKSGLTIRSGLARIASWAWMYKSFTLKDWAVFCQNYGQPIRLGLYDSSASEADKKVLWQAVSGIAGNCAAILHKSMAIDFKEVKNAEKGAELYEKRADWCDRQISKLVLGQTTTTDAVSGGHAVAQEHRLVQEDIERADAKLASSTLTRQLSPAIISFNFGPQEKYPRILIGRPDEVPLPIVISALKELGPQGLTIEASELRDRIGFSDPAPDAELIGGRTMQMFDQATRPQPHSAVRHLLSLHASAPEPEYVDRLTARLARDAAGALAGLSNDIRKVFEESVDLHEAARKLATLDLDPTAFAEAMSRGMALARLTGQAALLDELKEKP